MLIPAASGYPDPGLFRHAFNSLTCLLVCALSQRACAQALAAGRLTTPQALSQFCAAGRAVTCAVPLAGEYTLQLSGPWKVPRSLHFHFSPGSTLHISGGVLDFAGGSVDAPTDAAIFPDADRVRGLSAARPEWFAATTAEPVPAAALAAAYTATEPWGTLYLRARQYLSPFGNCPAVQPQLRFDSPRTIVGAGRPVPDDANAPNRLQGGTVLLGAIFGTAPLRLAHAGVDVGPQVSAGLLQGCQPPGIFIEQPADHQFAAGDRLEDVSVLTTGAFNMHSVMIAGHRDTEVRDLWIWCLRGTHGLVMKSSHSVVDGFHCWGPVSDCLIVKSDYATDLLGRAVEDRIAHVDIHRLQPEAYVGGIVVESKWDTVRSIDFSDISETGTHFGIVLAGSTFYRPRDITIRRWTSDATSGICLFADRSDAVQISDFRCGLTPSAQAGAVLRGSRDTVLRNGVFRCEGPPTACALGKTDGLLDDASGTSLQGVLMRGLGGFGMRSARRAPSPAGMQLQDMSNRLSAPWQISGHERLQEILAQTKPNLRILYTTVDTRARLQPKLFAAIAALIALLAAWGVADRRRRVAR